MFDLIAENAAIIFFGLIVMWFIQFGAAYWQMRRFYRRMVALRKNGLTAVGLNGDRLKGRAYAVLTIDGEDRIVHAEQFSGWTIFAGLRPVPELVGMPLQEILNNEAALPVSKKLRSAFVSAARSLQTAREKQLAGTSPKPVSDQLASGSMTVGQA